MKNRSLPPTRTPRWSHFPIDAKTKLTYKSHFTVDVRQRIITAVGVTPAAMEDAIQVSA